MELTPLLDISLGLFLLVFGPMVISAAWAGQGQGDDQAHVSLPVSVLFITLLISLIAAVASAWVYMLMREDRFLMQLGVTVFIALASGFALWAMLRQQGISLRHASTFVNSRLLVLAGLLMSLSGLFTVITFPLDGSTNVAQLRDAIVIAGIAAGFGTIGLLIFNLFFSEA